MRGDNSTRVVARLDTGQYHIDIVSGPVLVAAAAGKKKKGGKVQVQRTPPHLCARRWSASEGVNGRGEKAEPLWLEDERLRGGELEGIKDGLQLAESIHDGGPNGREEDGARRGLGQVGGHRCVRRPQPGLARSAFRIQVLLARGSLLQQHMLNWF